VVTAASAMTQCGWVKTPASSSDSPAIAVSA
jgi:hypothetical protein